MSGLHLRGFPLLPVVSALALLAALAAPALAAPAVQPTRAGVAVGDHVGPADCDQIAIEGSAILVGGVPLTPDQVAAMGLTGAVFELAASAAAVSAGDVCLDVAGLPGVPVVNGHIDICGEVIADLDALFVLNAQITVDGAQIMDGVRTVDIIETLQAADLAGAEACFSVDVVETRFFVQVVVPAICATTTLRAAQTLDLVIGQNELSLGQISVTQLTIIDPGGALQVDQAVDVGLELVASADFDVHSGELVITVVGADDCVAPATLPDVAMDEREQPWLGRPMVFIGLALVGGASMLRRRLALATG